MQIAARTGAWGGNTLPYLRRVAYLQSTGTEFVDTGITHIDTTDTVQLTMAYGTSQDNVSKGGFGYCQNAGRVRFHIWSYNDYYHFGCGTSNSWKNVAPLDLEFHEFTISGNGSCQFDGISFNLAAVPNDNNNNYNLFCANDSGTSRPIYHYYKGMKLSEFTFHNGNLIRYHMYPVLDLSGRPAMYDEVSGNLFYNQGTGEFTWGELET